MAGNQNSRPNVMTCYKNYYVDRINRMIQIAMNLKKK